MASSTREVGLRELLDTMRRLPKELVSKSGGPVKRALFLAAKPMKEQAIRNAQVDTGNLRSNIVLKRDPNPRASGVNERYIITVRKVKKSTKLRLAVKREKLGGVSVERTSKVDPYYWRFHEFGTAKMPAHPFIRPAFEDNKYKAVDIFAEELDKGVKRIVQRLYRKGAKP